MNLSVRLPSPVSIVCTGTDAPLFVRGRATAIAESGIDLELPEGSPVLRAGTPLILDFPSEAGGARAIVSVTRQDGNLVHATLIRVPSPDLREYPRTHGGVEVTYLVGGDAATQARWMEGAEVPGARRSPDPFMNFSATGLAFDDVASCREGDVVLVEFGLPGAPERFRAVGHVVRVDRIPIDERDDAVEATHRIAVHFTDIGDAGADALRQHTLRCQDAWIS